MVKTFNGKNLKIAVPKKGRLAENSLGLLKEAGLVFEIHERGLFAPSENYNIDLLFLRAADVPEYVRDGVVDLGITGIDFLSEKLGNHSKEVEIVQPLGYGKCSLVVAVPQESNISKIEDLENCKIATSYPIVTKKFFKSKKINVEIIEITGSVEITTALGVADAIVDITSTGTTIKLNRLRILDTVLVSEATLIKSRLVKPEKKELAWNFVSMVQSVLNGRQKKYIVMNAKQEMIESIKKILPSLEAPTVVPLTITGEIAIHSVLPDKDVNDVILKLKKIGATGIIVLPIEKIVY